jgi:hypothetical protein
LPSRSARRCSRHGDTEARDAVYANRNRLRSGIGKASMRKRAEIVERSFARTLERGGMRRTCLRGRENVHKRYLIHVAGHNLGILMRPLIVAGTPKEAVAHGRVLLFVVHNEEIPAILVFTVPDSRSRRLRPAHRRHRRLPELITTDTSSTGS